MRKSFFFLVIFFQLASGFAQLIPTGNWRTHYSYQFATLCEASDRYVYASSEQGFWRTSNSGEMKKLLKEDGFHSAEITHLAYYPKLQTLFIGYIDGNIDLVINDQRIVNVPGFYNKLLQGDKRINHVSFENNEALVSTNFGLLVVNLKQYEIKDSYTSIGTNGSSARILSSSILKDSVYASTVNGILAAKWSNTVNLNDYNQWHYVSTKPFANYLCSWNNSLYFVTDSIVYSYSNGTEIPVTNKPTFTARIFANDFGLHIVQQGNILNYTSTGQKNIFINVVVSATQFKDGIYWFCTGYGPGVIKNDNPNYAFMPNGPSSPSVFAMSKSGNQLICSGGGLSSTFGNGFNTSGFYIFNNGSWISNPESPKKVNMYDFTFVCHRNANNCDYIGSHTQGILVLRDKEIIELIDDKNSPLIRNNVLNFIQIGGIAEDSKGNLWIANYGASRALLCLTKSNAWYTFNVNTTDITGITIDASNRKWLKTPSGILVFDEGNLTNNFDDKLISINTSNGLVSNDVLSIAADKNGYVWIGTVQGLNVFTGSSNLFKSPKIDRFIVEQDGSTGYLMGEETILDILVDGGNRKWMATSNGLFAIDEYGQKVIKHFTAENSPLSANRIICLGQIDETGEIFIGTNKGIISYRNDAKVASESFGEIIVYPNPVPPKYEGVITIEGLANNAEIRITDSQAKLVYQTKANGGKATWNGYRLDGTKPNSGVYFVFGVNQDGSETAMGKFIFIK